MEEIDGYALVKKEEESKPAIAEEKDTFFNGDLLSFPDCPNHCVGGKIFDPYTHMERVCEYCSKKRSTVVRRDLKDKQTGKTIAELLKLPISFAGKEYQADTLVPTFARKDLNEDSLNKVLTELRDLLNKISVGTLPEHSLLFNLGKKVCENNYIYPFLLRAYKAGLTTAPMLSSIELMHMRSQYEEGYSSEFKDYLEKQVCVVVIDAGANYKEIMAVKGLMQLRANRELPTIIFTGYWQKYLFDLIGDDSHESFNLARLISVEYKDEEKNKDEESSNKVSATPRANPRSRGTSEISLEAFNKLKSNSNLL